MRTHRVNQTNQNSNQPVEIRLQPGQILRGKVLQIFPLDRALIQLGSFRFIAQLKASLEHGKHYYFQVDDVKKEVHLRVIQHVQEHGNNEWQQLLQMLGSRLSNIHENLLQQLIQQNIPFTKKTLQQMFTLLNAHTNQPKALNALVHMMHHNWPLTKEVMEAVIAYQSSTFTKQINHVYEELLQYTTTNQVHHSLLQHLEKLYPSAHDAAKLFASLFHHATKGEKADVQWLKWVHPQLNKEHVTQIKSMTTLEIQESIRTSRQLLHFFGVQTPKENEVFYHTLRTILLDIEVFQQDIHTFLHSWERNIQLQAIHNSQEQLDVNTHQKLQKSFIEIIPLHHMSVQQQSLMQQHIPRNVHQLLQMMVDLKELPFEVLKNMSLELEHNKPITQPKQHQTEFLRAIQHIIHHIGLSYEHMILEENTNKLMGTLKGLLLQFIQEQGIGSERARSLLQFIQGMQLHTVQETPHMLSVQLHIPAMIGRLQSDLHLTFDSKKTSSHTIDPEYCRILFDLELAALKRTMIDMHIQKNQVSFVIYTDISQVKHMAKPFEPILKTNLQQAGYEVTSIRYQTLSKEGHKHYRPTQRIEQTEGYDIKI